MMRRGCTHLSFFFLIVLVGVAARVTAAGQAGVTAPAGMVQPTAVDDVVAMNLKARGGVDLLRATESMKMSGTITTPRGVAKLTVWIKRPNRKRSEMEVGGERFVEGFDGTTSWVVKGNMPSQVLPPTPQLEEAKTRSEIDPVLLDYKERGRAVTLVGREKSDGAEVIHLRIVEKGRVTHYYIDAKTGLDKKVTNRMTSPDGMYVAQQELRFLDYRDVQGRMVPFTVQQVVDGKPVGQTKVDTVEFNVPIDDALFKMPGTVPRQPTPALGAGGRWFESSRPDHFPRKSSQAERIR